MICHEHDSEKYIHAKHLSEKLLKFQDYKIHDMNNIGLHSIFEIFIIHRKTVSNY